MYLPQMSMKEHQQNQKVNKSRVFIKSQVLLLEYMQLIRMSSI